MLSGVPMSEDNPRSRSSDLGKRTELGLAQRVEAVLTLMRREEPAAGIARRFGVAVWLFPNTLQQLWFMI